MAVHAAAEVVFAGGAGIVGAGLVGGARKHDDACQCGVGAARVGLGEVPYR